MSSLGLENNVWSPRNAAERVLMLLKMHGAMTSAALGDKLGTSGEAARQQLMRLAEEGLVEARAQSRGVGRPQQHWQLTQKAQDRFPDTHATLTVQLLDIVRAELGEAALDAIIGAREKATLALYRAHLDGAQTLREKLERLADIRSSEGYMAGVIEDEDGTLLLVENHCPICAAATACQNFCRSEKAVFEAALANEAHIERLEHIVSGARRCAYKVTPA